MQHRPSYAEFVEPRTPGHRRAGLSPADRRHAHARSAPSARSRKATGRFCSRASSAANAWAATAFSAPARSCASRPAATACRSTNPDGSRPAASWSSSIPIRCAARRDAGCLSRAASCRACRASAAAPSAMPATTPSATSSACRNPPPTTASLPDLCFAFYDRMVIFDHVNKTIAVVAHAHVDPRRPARAATDDACRARRSPGRAACSRAWPTCS